MARRTALVALLGLALLATMAQSASAAPRSCPNVRGGEVIFSDNIGCKNARRMVRAWVRRYRDDGRLDRKVHGFRCRAASDAVEGITMRCRRKAQSVRFYPNVPR